MVDCVFVDLTKCLCKLFKVHSLLVSFRELVAQFRYFKDRLDCLQFCKQLVVDLALFFDYRMSYLNLFLCEGPVLGELYFEFFVLGFHILIELGFLLPNHFVVQLDQPSQLCDLICLGFDAVCIVLRQIEVQNCHVIDCFSICNHKFLFFLKLVYYMQKSLYDLLRQNFVLFVHLLH